MRSLSEYIIKFEGLKQGTHFFEFDVDNAFFEDFDCFEFEKSSFKVDLEFEKQSTPQQTNYRKFSKLFTLFGNSFLCFYLFLTWFVSFFNCTC